MILFQTFLTKKTKGSDESLLLLDLYLSAFVMHCIDLKPSKPFNAYGNMTEYFMHIAHPHWINQH